MLSSTVCVLSLFLSLACLSLTFELGGFEVDFEFGFGYGEFGYSEYGYGELEVLVGLFSSWRSVLKLVWSLGSKALGRARRLWVELEGFRSSSSSRVYGPIWGVWSELGNRNWNWW